MTQSNLLPIRANSVRVYVIFSPSSRFRIQHDESRLHLRMAERISKHQLTASFADVRFSTKPISAIFRDEKLRGVAELDWNMLTSGHFGSLWLYGDFASEFLMNATNVAIRSRIQIGNFSEKNSILDRYLCNWIYRFGTPTAL